MPAAYVGVALDYIQVLKSNKSSSGQNKRPDMLESRIASSRSPGYDNTLRFRVRYINASVHWPSCRDELEVGQFVHERRCEFRSLSHGADDAVRLKAICKSTFIVKCDIKNVYGEPVLNGRPVSRRQSDMLIIIKYCDLDFIRHERVQW